MASKILVMVKKTWFSISLMNEPNSTMRGTPEYIFPSDEHLHDVAGLSRNFECWTQLEAHFCVCISEYICVYVYMYICMCIYIYKYVTYSSRTHIYTYWNSFELLVCKGYPSKWFWPGRPMAQRWNQTMHCNVMSSSDVQSCHRKVKSKDLAGS